VEGSAGHRSQAFFPSFLSLEPASHFGVMIKNDGDTKTTKRTPTLVERF
jgi:hypothetical protein